MANVVVLGGKVNTRVESEVQENADDSAREVDNIGMKGLVGGLKQQLLASKPAAADFCRVQFLQKQQAGGVFAKRRLLSRESVSLPEGMSEESATQILKAMLAMDMATRNAVATQHVAKPSDGGLCEQMELF